MVYKFVLFVLIIAPFSAQPHSGRTNAEGCHTDKVNNDYHCHNEVGESVPSRTQLPPLPENYATSFSNAKFKAERDVYYDYNATFYCQCGFVFDDIDDADNDGNTHETMVDALSCGYTPRNPVTSTGKPNARVSRIEWEHIMPAYIIGGELDQWQNQENYSECQKPNDKYLTGRDCAYETVPTFRRAHDDLVNLAPAVGELNADRSNFQFSIITGETRNYGQCDFEVDFNSDTAEPAEKVRGDIARVYLYMIQMYGISLNNNVIQIIQEWNESDPVDEWECKRNVRIKKSQGYSNPIVEDLCNA
ncbi:endonuclease [Pseudoalteromonas sp. A2]|uniref:endonuclease n=1 Tax=Pseudoalteromonas sp. A2 TaxID=1523412 RepID=UPI0009DEB548|nr:endonuclease [Pseudoalteromonas sp. A2]|tara:strand:- start:754 stop:1665 length:912 start_codon:yes stop_codon:yes gene_type:complete